MSERYLHEMIDDIEMIIDDAKSARLNPGKIIIDQDLLITAIEELRKQIPTEIERSHKIILSKDIIIDEAKVEAKTTIDQAAKEAASLIEQNEIVEMAKMRTKQMEDESTAKADEILNSARAEAEQIRLGALQYSKEVMEDIRDYVQTVKEGQESLYSQLISTMNGDLESIEANYNEICSQVNAGGRSRT